MADLCTDNRFEIIAKAKAHLLEATNINTSEDEMKVLDSFLFRCWQMGWLDRYDRKTEPSVSEIPNNCDTCKHNKLEWYSEVCDSCCGNNNHYEPQDEPQTDCDDRYALRTDSGEVVAYACPLSCEQTDCSWK